MEKRSADSIGGRIAHFREELDLTIKDMALQIGCDHSQLSAIERGKRVLSLAIALNFCRRFDVSLDWLFFGMGTSLVEKAIAMPSEPTQPSAVTNELLFETLKALRHDVAEVRADVIEVKGRLGLIEAQYANLSSRADRIDERTRRIEDRLSLIEA